MPTRVTSGSDMAARDKTGALGPEFSTTQARSLNSSYIEDIGSAGMGIPAWKGYLQEYMGDLRLTNNAVEASPSTRFLGGTSDGEIALISLNATKSAVQYRANPGARRKLSVRETRAPPGQASSQSSPSKRISTSYSFNRPNAPDVSNTQQVRQPSINDISRFSFGSIASTTGQGVSLGSGGFIFSRDPNFDDFHASNTYEEPDLSSFPAPGGRGHSIQRKPVGDRVMEHNNEVKGVLEKTSQEDATPRIGRSNSLMGRKNSVSNKGTNIVGSINAMGPPIAPAAVAPAAMRGRRKSHFPTRTVPSDHTSRPPRKSVGPGTLPQDFAQESSQRKRAYFGPGNSSQKAVLHDAREASMNEVPPRLRLEGQIEGTEKTRRQTSMAFQPPPRLVHDNFPTPSGTPDNIKSLTINTSLSPARSSGQSTNTPLSGKRLSVMSGTVYATGLGARTISPTDARRLKRMSIMPHPPPIPSTPPAPQPDQFLFSPRSSARSPSMIPRKSVTPSSSRTTPEANRKSYSSGISNSSSTSYNSFPNSSGPSRLSQSMSTSRLPTPKNRNEVIQGSGEEEVPPVPAIPKAYESPKADVDQPFFSVRKSSFPFETSSQASPLTTEGIPTPSSDNDTSVTDRDLRYERGVAIEAGSGNERKQNGGAGNGRRTLQPLRLPPLNLLPLSTPTAAKISALYEGASSTNLGNLTPPPKIGLPTTPSTPMTASKVGFFSKSSRDEHTMPVIVQRPNSSVQNTVTSSVSSYRGPSNSSSIITIARDQHPSRASRKAVSPFVSSSLPKSSYEFDNSSTAPGESSTAENFPQVRPQKLTGPRSQQFSKVPRDQSSTFENRSPAGSSTPSMGSSLRRKLSLSRKRSGSKATSIVDFGEEIPPKPPKHDQMPPPRLPASATWNGPLLSGPSPTHRLNILNTRRKASNPNVHVHNDRNRSNTWASDGSPQKESPFPGSSLFSDPAVTSSSGELASMPSSLSLKDFLRETKTMELQLDRDDLLAEDEMKKLAARRKDTETAAKEFDALRRRATAKERVSPVQALRMAHLNIFERGEIVDYKDIFFCGTRDARKHVGNLSTETANFGYDDERGDYNIAKGDHLLYRYEIIDILGKGSFGQVVRCIDHKTGGLVAIKIIRNKKRFHQQALVEVDILQKLREWDPHNKHSMVNFTQSFYFRGHLCISTELLGMNLYEFIKSHDFRGFSLKLIRRFTKQLLSSLVLLKGHKVIHCDLKPENILLAHPARSEIKVIDFGSSCLENEKVYTYIQSRFYRSPEVILGMTYGMPIDMWSLGCILAELLTGYPIFPGENEQEQLACIMEVFGPPEKHLIEKSTRKKLFFDSLGKPRLTVSTKGKRRRPSSKSLQQVLKCEDDAFLDFISRCLRWDPDRRLKPDEAMRHEFITGTKTAARPLRPHLSTATSSPVKRYNSTQTPAGTRPLPEPPVTSLKNGTATRAREIPSSSPVKVAAVPLKRHSTVNGLQSNPAGKRTLNGNSTAVSALPRVASRVVSAKSDMAMAAATASLVRTMHDLRPQPGPS